jgi:hypothetical protein
LRLTGAVQEEQEGAKKFRMRAFATGCVLVTVLLTTGCATAPLESQTQVQDKRHARIYVLRESSLLYSGGAPNVKINGQNVGTVASSSSFFVDRPPGSYVITLETPLVPGRYAANVTMGAGAVHYLKVAPEPSILPSVSPPAASANWSSRRFLKIPAPTA